MLLALFLAARFTDLSCVGVWIDYCCLPQRITSLDIMRSPLELAAFKAVLQRLSDLQLACTADIVCATSDAVQDYGTRGWCVCEIYVHSARVTSRQGGIDTVNHAVADDLPSAYLNAIEVALLLPVDDAREIFTCSKCGEEEVWHHDPENQVGGSKERQRCLLTYHESLCGTDSPPYSTSVWKRLATLQRLAAHLPVGVELPDKTHWLMAQRRTTRLSMALDTDWAAEGQSQSNSTVSQVLNAC